MATPRTQRTLAARRGDLFDEIYAAARDATRHDDLDWLLRVLCRELLPALTEGDRAEIAEFEPPLRFVAGALLAAIRKSDPTKIDRAYLIGRVESLLDLCALATTPPYDPGPSWLDRQRAKNKEG